MAKTSREQVVFKINDILSSESGQYQIKNFLGQGVYGKVAECINLGTNEKVAVKIVRKSFGPVGQREARMFEELEKSLDQNKSNLIRLTEHFTYQRHVCLVFEMLDISLCDLVRKRFDRPLCLSEIRVISQQMLVALNALKSIRVVHSDIKPDNIMLVNQKLQPFKLKLIDFGLAVPVPKIRPGCTMQAIAYRAPEVILGLPLNEAVDMWSLGCILAYMYLGRHLYAFRSEYEVLKFIVQTQGQPDDQLLNAGIHTWKYFSKDEHSPGAPWRLIRRAEAQEVNFSDNFTSLDDVMMTRAGAKNGTEDKLAFLSLLKRMLRVDPSARITPSEALGHRFITMKHLASGKRQTCNTYVKAACLTIKNSQLDQPSVIFNQFVTSSEVISCNQESATGLDHPPPGEQEITARVDSGETAAVGPNHRATATADRNPAGNDDAPPATAGLHEADKKPPGTNKAPSANCQPVGINNADEGSQVRTRNRWFKRLRNFPKMNFATCCTADVIE
ncbi:homeodomain-interacting protein kinase 3-like [Chelmon rostratus]|uniref:homeodomain-interacting protein kinase 3-like n=1 Tax=Chelmon rostratus TaxID=109905 RepID=UPI001BE78E8F|nr:homeodomain-interacting protein kinase 3-like [Chelmon rostratus]